MNWPRTILHQWRLGNKKKEHTWTRTEQRTQARSLGSGRSQKNKRLEEKESTPRSRDWWSTPFLLLPASSGPPHLTSFSTDAGQRRLPPSSFFVFLSFFPKSGRRYPIPSLTSPLGGPLHDLGPAHGPSVRLR